MKFAKYHGCGNNFIILEYKDVETLDLSKVALQVCDYNIGIGADGLIVVKTDPLEMIFYNQDGSRAPMCGNGIRCFAKYVKDNNIVKTDIFNVETLGGLMKVECIDNEYKINMGKPLFNKDLLKLSKDIDIFEFVVENTKVSSVFMGTIHSVIFTDKINYEEVETLGAKICNNPLFKEKTNVNFVEVIDKDNIKVLTYERGVGITKACGTGCCASFVYAHKFNKINNEVNVHLELGVLKISYQDDDVMMQGPAEKIAEGEIELC